MDGIFVGMRRPNSKKAVKEALAAENGERNVILEVTRFGREEKKYVFELEEGKYNFVGPDPYTARKFYGVIEIFERNGERIVRVS